MAVMVVHALEVTEHWAAAVPQPQTQPESAAVALWLIYLPTGLSVTELFPEASLRTCSHSASGRRIHQAAAAAGTGTTCREGLAEAVEGLTGACGRSGSD